jgi:hypothetical protein
MYHWFPTFHISASTGHHSALCQSSQKSNFLCHYYYYYYYYHRHQYCQLYPTVYRIPIQIGGLHVRGCERKVKLRQVYPLTNFPQAMSLNGGGDDDNDAFPAPLAQTTHGTLTTNDSLQFRIALVTVRQFPVTAVPTYTSLTL